MTADYLPPPVLLLGDVHGDAGWFRLVCDKAERLGVDTILQLGDFGYWEHRDGGAFLDSCSDALAERSLDCIWIDGNHENHTVLRRNYGPEGDRHEAAPGGFWRIRPRLFYAPRGLRWEWHGATFVAAGGAYSIDKAYRVEGSSWWPEETLTDAEVEAIIGDGSKVDVVVAHDAPVLAEGVMGPQTVGDKDSWPESKNNRVRVQRIVDRLRPKLLVHGHYHHRNSTHVGDTRVEGFGRDGDPDALGLLDLATLRIHPAHTGAVGNPRTAS